jgi:hypothetical protein
MWSFPLRRASGAVMGGLGPQHSVPDRGICLASLAHDGASEVTIRQEHRGYRYQLAALGCFLIFADNVLRRLEGSGETIWAWVSSGRWELIFVSGYSVWSCSFCSGRRL